MISKKNIIAASRYNDWWGCKMSPLLAIGYGTAIVDGTPLYRSVGWILLLIGALVVGGVYASSVNDLCDLAEDEASGKTNRLSQIPRHYRWLFPAGAFALGVVLAFYLLSLSVLAAILYALPCLCFTLYSMKPFRLKSRGIWGVVADASGAHIFPGLCLVVGTSALSGAAVNWTWFGVVGIWSACFGLRGILWHQFQDRVKDMAVGLGTFATSRRPERFRAAPLVIIVTELAAFAVMVWMLAVPLAIPLLFFYFLLVYYRSKALGLKTGIVLTSGAHARQIFMLDYYTFFFPMAVLLSVIGQPFVWLLLLVHLIAFPLTPLQMLRDLYLISRTAFLARIR